MDSLPAVRSKLIAPSPRDQTGENKEGAWWRSGVDHIRIGLLKLLSSLGSRLLFSSSIRDDDAVVPKLLLPKLGTVDFFSVTGTPAVLHWTVNHGIMQSCYCCWPCSFCCVIDESTFALWDQKNSLNVVSCILREVIFKADHVCTRGRFPTHKAWEIQPFLFNLVVLVCTSLSIKVSLHAVINYHSRK